VPQRILFFAENVTLAQVVRLVTLARALDPERYEVHFACSDFPDLAFAGTGFVRHPIATLPAEVAARALRAGRRLYEEDTLHDYVEAETALIDAVRPDLVVGDFRLSLSTSAELCGVPCGVLINAYWSPFAPRERFPVPDHPILAWLGEARTERYFPRAVPYVFRHFAAPVDAVRKRRGLAPIGGLLEVLTHGDHTLYPDDPVLTPVSGAPPSHHFLGPVIWQPDNAAVSELASGVADFAGQAAANGVPLVYVTLGSSGDLEVLPHVITALGRLPVRAVVATAGRLQLRALPPNVRAEAYVRGSDLARRARVVVSNGGSTTGYQALAEGVPVLGIPSNLDQFLATEAIVVAGAGSLVKARRATPEAIAAALQSLLDDPEKRQGAQRIMRRFKELDSGAAFRSWVARAVRPATERSEAKVAHADRDLRVTGP
jgi:UDP:flavonoid glycosyltransferase YjiC (YdhE family)